MDGNRLAKEKIRVIARSEGRGEETPRVIYPGGKLVDVLDVIDRWLESGRADRSVRRCFRIRGSDGGIYRVEYWEASGEWFVA